MNIAIIGSGISGLTAAYMLHNKHQITIYEKNDYIGGHTHTHDIDYQGKNWAIDSGFIVYNERTYPNFINLLDELGVQRQLTRMGFSIKSKRINLEYAGHSLNGLFAQRLNLIRPLFIRMLKDMYQFNKQARNDVESISYEMTLGEYLKLNGYSKEFIDYYIIPIGAAIWSTIPTEMMNIPAIFFIRFFDNHGLLQLIDRPNWWVIKGGSKRYVEKMITNFKDHIEIATPVHQVIRREKNVTIIYGKGEKHQKSFDAVIFATHSNQALRLLEKPTKQEIDILGSIKYQKNSALLHFDNSILPQRKHAWSSWNYLLDKDQEKPVALTYNMNILQNLNCSRTFCVTLNSEELVNPNKIIKELSYEHPLFTLSGIKAQGRKYDISGKNNTYYCGAYWHNGFHEDGVVSALDVCKQIEKNKP